jgi:mono/diheme cytochrome c family protein
MRRLARWLGAAVGIAALGAIALASWVYLRSEAYLHSFERPPPFTLAIPDDDAARARGEHLVRTRGCAGCHGDDLGGQLMWGHAVAPNLPQLAREIGAADFEAALRHGIDHTGRAMYSMPSYNFLRLRDADVSDIIAYLRSAPVVLQELPSASLPWSIRWDLARDRDVAIAGILHRVPPLKRLGEDSKLARGEYLAMTTCNECHGLTLHADSPFEEETAPSLVVIAGYDEAAFTRLMRTGKALGDRELEMMSGVARGRFVHFTDDEVRDLYAYLKEEVVPGGGSRVYEPAAPEPGIASP